MKYVKYIILITIISSCYLLNSTRKINNKINPLNESLNVDLKAYWIGHATVLIKMYDKWILTDPIWNDNLLYTLGRHVEPGIDLENIPPIDYIIISHVHLDHLDTYTLKKLSKKAHLILPKGAPDFSGYNFQKISYLSKDEFIESENLKITAVVAQHFGGRWAIDNLWDGEPYNGYIISNKGATVYFAGDTGYNSKDFKEIGEKYKIYLALIPVGPYRGKIFGDENGNAVHVSPLGAVQIFRDTKAKKMIPIHHGTFYSNPDKEIVYVKSAIESSGLKERIFLIEQGSGISFGN
jgi:N-acyl-phosphatidylethanolamine-hydrolysing phospholipase D